MILANLGASRSKSAAASASRSWCRRRCSRRHFAKSRSSSETAAGPGASARRAGDPLRRTSSNAMRGRSCCRRSAGSGSSKLKAASVAVIGAGGIGSAVIPALAGAGIGRLTIIDDDVVELANLHRQPLFREGDVGQPKAELAAQFVAAPQPLRRSRTAFSSGSTPTMRGELLAGHDLVIDGSDNFATRLAVSDACVGLGMPLLSAAAVQFQGQVGLFRGAALLSLLCRRCVRRRGLRQLRGARRARRADRRRSAASRRCSRSTPSSASARIRPASPSVRRREA